MAHDPLALLLHAGDAFAAQFRHAPGFEARTTGESWFASAGEAHCLWNWACLTGASAANVATLHDVVARLRERHIEGLVCYPPDAESGFAETFRALGLDEPGVVPFMVLDAAGVPPLVPTDIAVERITGGEPERLAGAVAVVSNCFEIPADQTARVFDVNHQDEPDARVHVALRGGVVAGALATTRLGDMVSIDIMAVDPAAQRQGIGRALMLGVMHEHIAAGADGFHLLSSTDGQRLYQQLGFTTVLPTHTRLIPIDPIPPDRVV